MKEIALVVVFLCLLSIATFKQECRFTRIARNRFITYQDFYREVIQDIDYVVSYVLIVLAIMAIPLWVHLGFRLPQDIHVYLLSFSAVIIGAWLRSRALRRLWRRR